METTTKPGPNHGPRILLLAFCATMSMVMGVTSVMPMIPMLAREFAVSHTHASLVLTVFTFPGILFALPAGILADKFGRKVVLVPSFFLFGIAGTACAFAPDFPTLLFFRTLQGIGAIALGVLNTTIIADVWPGKELPRMIGYNMTVLSLCTAIYPAVGGALAYLNWHYAFFLPLLALPAGVVAIFTPLARPSKTPAIREYLGNLGHAFQNRRMLALLCMTMLTFMLLYGPIITCFPVLADTNFHANSAMIGMAMIFSSLGTAAISSRLGFLSKRFSSPVILFCSQGLYITTLLLLPQASGLYWALPPLLLYGMGQGLNIPTVQSLLLQAAPQELRASIMAINGMLLRLGQSLAPVSFSVVMASFGITWGFYAGIALAALLTLLVAFFLPAKTAKGTTP